MLKLFNAIFIRTWYIQNKITDFNVLLNTTKGKRVYRLSAFITLFLAASLLFISKKNPTVCKNILFLIYEDIVAVLLLGLFCVYDFIKMLTSLRYFMAYGFFLSIVLILIISSLFKIPNAQFQWYVVLAFFLVWCALSIIANSSVSIIANSIVAGVISVIILTGNTLITMIPTEYPPLPQFTEYIMKTKVIYTYQQKMQIDFNLTMMPSLLINGSAAMLAAIKSYWTKKYNDGNEIFWEKDKIK